MEPWSAEKEEPHRVQLSALYWRIFFFTTRSIAGCNGNTRTSHSSDMLMMLSATVEARLRRWRLRQALEQRFAECGLATASAKDQGRLLQVMQIAPGHIPERSLRLSRLYVQAKIGENRDGKHFVSFLPAVSSKAAKRMRQSVRRWRLHRRNDLELEEIAAWVRPVLSGWVRYYGRFYPSKLRSRTPHD